MIRAATPDDVPALVALGRQMHAESPVWRRLRFDADRLAGTIRGVLAMPLGFARVVEGDDGLHGAIVAMAIPHFCSRDLVACDVGLFMAPEHRGGMAAVRLVNEYKAWAHGVGAVIVQLGVTTGVQVEQTARLCERLGWSRAGLVMEA